MSDFDIDAAGNKVSGAPFDCPVCTQRVVFIDAFGHPMLCDVTILIFGDERRDWGTSGPHTCP